jgi:hypothetical protein
MKRQQGALPSELGIEITIELKSEFSRRAKARSDARREAFISAKRPKSGMGISDGNGKTIALFR